MYMFNFDNCSRIALHKRLYLSTQQYVSMPIFLHPGQLWDIPYIVLSNLISLGFSRFFSISKKLGFCECVVAVMWWLSLSLSYQNFCVAIRHDSMNCKNFIFQKLMQFPLATVQAKCNVVSSGYCTNKICSKCQK